MLLSDILILSWRYEYDIEIILFYKVTNSKEYILFRIVPYISFYDD